MHQKILNQSATMKAKGGLFTASFGTPRPDGFEGSLQGIQTPKTLYLGSIKVYGSLPTPLSDPEFRTQIEELEKYLKNAKSFLDIGCGFGNMLRHAREINPKIVANGLEVQKRQAEIARDFGEVFKINAFNFRKYGDYDVLFMYRPIVEYRDQLDLEDRVIAQMKPGAVLISLIPAHIKLLGATSESKRGVYLKN